MPSSQNHVLIKNLWKREKNFRQNTDTFKTVVADDRFLERVRLNRAVCNFPEGGPV